MRTKKLTIFSGVMVAAVLLAGCGSTPERPLSKTVSSYATLPNGHDPLNPGQLSSTYAAATQNSASFMVPEK